MSRDQMQDVFPIDINFKKGEQVTSTKLTGQARQIDTAFSRVTQAVGDPWEYSVHSGSAGDYTLSPERLAQASLSRMIGPSDYISPPGNSFDEVSGGRDIQLKIGKNSWNIGFPLVKNIARVSPDSQVDSTVEKMELGPDFSISNSEDLLFETPVDSQNLITEDGEFHINYYTGTITTYSPTTDIATLTINNMSMIPAGIPWGTANVIPSWKQTAGLCNVIYFDVVANIQKYTLELPTINAQPRLDNPLAMLGGNHSRFDGDGGAQTTADAVFVSSSAPGIGIAKYTLPYSITSTLVDGDVLPEGFCLLWDGTRIVRQVTFIYRMPIPTEPQIPFLELQTPEPTTGFWLTSGDTTYRLIITGASLAETVGYLSSVVRDNRHIGLTEGSTSRGTLAYTAPLSHGDMSDLYTADFTGYVGDINRLSFTKSKVPTNDHPQYLHRGGWFGSSEETEGNTRNAMRGNITFSSITDYGDPAKSYLLGDSNALGFRSSTYGINFGGGCLLSFVGGNENDWISGQSNRLHYNNVAVGANTSSTNEENKGALVYSPWERTPLHLRGDSSGDVSSYKQYYSGGATLGFDFHNWNEMNYIKLMPGSRETIDVANIADVPNLPADTHTSNWTRELACTSGLDNRLSEKQIREFRFRGVSFVPEADTAGLSGSDPGQGIGTEETDLEKYFTSPGIVGADFFNVYSNAIFFSEQGDGKWTSFTERSKLWLSAGQLNPPTGLYYLPSDKRYEFIYWDNNIDEVEVVVGNEGFSLPFTTGKYSWMRSWSEGVYPIALVSRNSTSSTSIYVNSQDGGILLQAEKSTGIESIKIKSTAGGVNIETGKNIELNADVNVKLYGNADKTAGQNYSLISCGTAISLTANINEIDLDPSYITIDQANGINITSSDATNVTIHGHKSVIIRSGTAGPPTSITLGDNDIELRSSGSVGLTTVTGSDGSLWIDPSLLIGGDGWGTGNRTLKITAAGQVFVDL